MTNKYNRPLNFKYKKGQVVNPHKQADEFIDENDIGKPWHKGYAQTLKKLGFPTKKIIDSIKNIVKTQQKLVSAGEKTEREAKSDSHHKMEASLHEGIRLAVVEASKVPLAGRMCMMLGTSAEHPDEEHAQYEGVAMDCEELMVHLGRFGCKHNYKILD